MKIDWEEIVYNTEGIDEHECLGRVTLVLQTKLVQEFSSVALVHM